MIQHARSRDSFQSNSELVVNREEKLNMKTNHKVALGVLVGVAIGAAGATVIHAQQVNVPPAYFIAEVDMMPDATTDQKDAFSQKYQRSVGATVLASGGRYLVIGGKTQALEGEPPKRIIMVAFDSAEKARSWYDSPAYAAIRPFRQAAMKSRTFIVDGVTP
jgi:uncharacterized protein (DUF1330 family)